MSMNMLMVLLVIGVALWMMRRLVRWIGRWRKLYSFDNYVADHPESVTSGSVRCHACGNASIYLTRVGHTPLSIRHAHLCRRRGATLYFSRTYVDRTHDQDK